MTDEQLMTAVTGDCRDSFDDLAARWRPKAERYVAGYCQKPDSDSIVDAAIGQLWEQRASYIAEHGFAPYFYRVVSGTLYQSLKRHSATDRQASQLSGSL